MKCDEIFAALAMLEKERGIPQSFMMGKIIQALTTAYKRDHEGVENVIVDVDEEKKDLKMFVQKEIVEEVRTPAPRSRWRRPSGCPPRTSWAASSTSPWRAWSSAVSPPATASRSSFRVCARPSTA
jgi:hypothetical protein